MLRGIHFLIFLLCANNSYGASQKSILIEHNATLNDAKKVSFPLVAGAKDVWVSKDGISKCVVDPWGKTPANQPLKFFFECYAKGLRTQVTLDCSNMLGKSKAVGYFIGGDSDYNQNFKIWCE